MKRSDESWVVTESYRLVKDNTFTLIYWPRSCQLKSIPIIYIRLARRRDRVSHR